MKPPLTWLKMTPVDLLVVLERLLELAPALFAARLVARQHGFAERVLDAIEEHLDLVADLELALTAGAGEFAQRNAAFGLQADVDDGHVLFDRNNLALDDGAFLQVAACEGLVEHRGEIVARGVIGISRSRSHLFSSCGCLAGRWVHGRIARAVSEGPQNLRATARCPAETEQRKRAGRGLHVRYVEIFVRSLDRVGPKQGPSVSTSKSGSGRFLQ